MHRHLNAGSAACLRLIELLRADLVVAVAGLFPWSWLADRGAGQGIPGVLGHALARKGMHWGHAKHDTLEAQKAIQDSSWKAQVRLCKRYRRLVARGKRANQVVVAIARELVGFLRAIAKQVPVAP